MLKVDHQKVKVPGERSVDSSTTLRTKLRDLERGPEVRRLPAHLAVAPMQKEQRRARVLLENQISISRFSYKTGECLKKKER